MATAWNHNTHHHDVLLRAVPPTARRGLEVGCGLGRFARELSHRVTEVVAIDRDPAVIARAKAELANTSIDVRCADFLAETFERFDVITMIAVLHHMPLARALEHAARALVPGGVLAIIGLSRQTSLADHAAAAVSLPLSHVLRRIRPHAEVGAPVHDPAETLDEIREIASRVL